MGGRFSKYKKYIGKTINNLTILNYHSKNKRGEIRVNCICFCGRKTVSVFYRLLNGKITSCGCDNLRSFKYGDAVRTHKHHKFYISWTSMVSRCTNEKNPSYKNYGERGISFQNSWSDYLSFKRDMYFKWVYASKKYRKELKRKNNPLTLERRDVNGNYCFDNCEFIPKSFQGKNKRNVLKIKGTNIKTKQTIVEDNQIKMANRLKITNTGINNCISGKAKSCGGWVFEKII